AREVAILAPEKLGAGLTAIVEISLDVQTAEELDAFEGDILNEPAIQQVYRVSTGPDFILILQLPDMPAYHTLAHRLFTSKKNVRNVRTFWAVHRSKFATRLPLPRRPWSELAPVDFLGRTGAVCGRTGGCSGGCQRGLRTQGRIGG